MNLIDFVRKAAGRTETVDVGQAAAMLGLQPFLVEHAVDIGDLPALSKDPIRIETHRVEEYGREMREQRRAVTEAIRLTDELEG